ncbi:MAG: elongation factor G [Desulfobacterales bacterium]|nr:elongation factor G [Desulfobacterales bacterium]MBF0396794.1 elongation factor G [Desulfobacterales bacterium]
MSEMVEKLRNIALVGHSSAGKTSLAEVILFKTGITTRIGRVEDNNTVMDFEPEELKRNVSISTGFNQFSFKKHTINILDTPGEQNFFMDTKICMQAVDCAIFVIDGVDGIKVQTELAWDFAKDYNLPSVIFINKLDKERSNFSRSFEDAKKILTPKPILLQLPIGSEKDFKGVVDLLSMKAYIYDAQGKATVSEVPKDLKDAAEAEIEGLIENIAEADDALLEKYLEGVAPSPEELNAALKKGILNRIFVPVLCGSAINQVGVDLLLDFIVNCVPSPQDFAPKKGLDPNTGKEITRAPDPNAPFSAFVFKTVADPYAGRLSIFRIVSGKIGSDGNFFNVNKDNRERYTQLLRVAGKEQKTVTEAGPGAIVAVAKLKNTTTGDTICDEGNKIKYPFAESLSTLITFALVPKSKADEDKIYTSLTKLLEEDVALKINRNAETKEILLSGMGQVHIEATIEKLKRKFNVEVQLNTPKIPYKETIKKKARVQGKHKKQSGGHGQYGDCWVQFEPLPRGSGLEFVDAIVGGSIPRQYIPAVEKGIVEACQKGILAGFPCVDFKATVDDGSYHDVDSSEMAFKIAASLAFKKGIEAAQPVLLEPIMKVHIITPDDFLGDIMGNLNSRRGRVLGMETKGKNQVVIANVPMAEFLTYAPDLNSMTGGRGFFTMEFSHYDEVPAQITQKVVEEINKTREKEKE